MGLEVADYISQLDATNPVGATDPKSQGDDHLRLLKHVLQTQFSALGEEAVTATAAQLNTLAAAGPYIPPVFANPTAQIGLAAINGVAATFMRSDAAPAINQAISPTWTASHKFTKSYAGAGSAALLLESANPVLKLQELGGSANAGGWLINADTNTFNIYAASDDESVLRTVLSAPRAGGVGLGTISFGNAIDNPNLMLVGSGIGIFGNVRSTNGLFNSTGTLNINFAIPDYGTVNVTGSNTGYCGYRIADGGLGANFMANTAGSVAGIHITADSKWLIERVSSTAAQSNYNLVATSFTVASSRTLKRETGTPYRTGEILSRLRPILYKLIADGDNAQEQYGLIAEEVQALCPQLSDGKSVMYDRLAVLLLAAWQEDHAHG